MKTKDIYPCIIHKDRYNGAYSGAKWTAWNCYIEEIPEEIEWGDSECWNFWEEYNGIVGKGDTPSEAYKDLELKIVEL